MSNDTSIVQNATEVVSASEDARGKRAADELQGSPPLAKPDWHLGLLLHPRHFERQDRYHEDLVRYALRTAFDPAWGISELAIDDEALDAGVLRITRFRGILSDGMLVVADAAQIPARNLARELRIRSRVDVYLGVPLDDHGAHATGDDPRYLKEVALVPDYATGRDHVELPWCRPNLRLLTGDEPLGGYATVPVTRIHHVQGRATLDLSFIAPVLRVRASPVLEACVRRVERGVVTTKDAMGEHRRANAEMTGSDAGRLLVGTVLGRFAPLLRGLLTSDPVHPREAYGVLAGLAGALSAFAPSGAVEVPSFEFSNLGVTFSRLEEAIGGILNAIGGPAIRAIPLHQQDDNFWRTHAPFEQGIFGREFLLILSGGDSASLQANVPRSVKVAAWEEIGDIVQRSLPGVALMPEVRRPHGVQVPPHAACFRLDRRGPQWTSIMNYGSLALWLPQPLASLQPTLLTQEPNAFGG